MLTLGDRQALFGEAGGGQDHGHAVLDLVPRVGGQLPAWPLRHEFAGGPQPGQVGLHLRWDEEVGDRAWQLGGSPEPDDNDPVGAQPGVSGVVGRGLGQVVVAVGEGGWSEGQRHVRGFGIRRPPDPQVPPVVGIG